MCSCVFRALRWPDRVRRVRDPRGRVKVFGGSVLEAPTRDWARTTRMVDELIQCGVTRNQAKKWTKRGGGTPVQRKELPLQAVRYRVRIASAADGARVASALTGGVPPEEHRDLGEENADAARRFAVAFYNDKRVGTVLGVATTATSLRTSVQPRHRAAAHR